MREESNSITTDQTFDLTHLSRYFAELSPQPMVAVEGVMYIVRHVNAAFEQLAGKNRSQLIGRPFDMAVPEGVANRCMSMLDRVYRTGTPETLAEQKHRETPPVYWSYTVWTILGNDERPVGLMIQVTDSTETAVFRGQATAMNQLLMLSGIRQHELTETVEALNAGLQADSKAKDHFMAVLGHELRNPLSPVLIIASVLRQDPRFDADTREQLEIICRNAELAARLIDDLLDVTRIKRGKVELDRRPIDLCTIIRRVMDDCMPDIKVRKLELGVDLGPGPYRVNADVGRLQQVFWNLLKNAIKFTPVGGCVGVRCRLDGEGFVVAEVNDSGEGIEPEAMGRIFNAFDQGDRSITRQFGGLGLGLTISKALVKMHGGSIQAHSEGKGKGATFTVRLPLLTADAAVPTVVATSEAPSPAAASRPLRILLVEDHRDTALVMRRVLSAQGHEVEIATDVATALRLTGQQTFDLLLSDLGLPDGSGLDLMRALRGKGINLPGIALSGYGQEKDMQASREAGFVAHLVKPVNLSKLKEEIAKAVGPRVRP